MPSLLDPDDDQTLGQTGAGLLRIGQDDGSDQGAALADLYRRVTEPQAAPTGSPHMLDAQQDLGLTPQEQYLYQTHLNNLSGPGKVFHPNGAISTLYQMSFGQGGKFYNIPTVWGGAIVPPDEAIARANAVGLDQFPAYSSEQEAEDRYSRMHDYMERDTADYVAARAAIPNVVPRWDADNPVGTETTQTLRQATPIVSPERYQAHQQVQQAMELAPTMALGMLGGMGEVPKPARLAGPVADAAPGYVYHATNLDRLEGVRSDGRLNTHDPGDFTDQDVWPDGSTEKRNYFTPTAQNTWQFAPEDGPGVLLRAPQGSHPFKTERGTGDIYSTKPVPAQNLEYHGEGGGWHPVLGDAQQGNGP